MSNRTIQHPPRQVHEPEPQARCNCEHRKHFPDAHTGALEGHAYGCEFPAKHITHAAYVGGVCPACQQTCQQEY